VREVRQLRAQGYCPQRRVNVREIWRGVNNIDQQSWPMFVAMNRN
jgi:hypothetical protein